MGSPEGKTKVAIVGAGISGISCAYRLKDACDVTLFEKNDYVGGHTNTVDVTRGSNREGNGDSIAVDTGFIVLNDKNYPRLHQFFRELEVPVRESDMSFGFSCERSGFAYAGTSFSGLFASRSNALRPHFWKLLSGIYKFCRSGANALQKGDIEGKTIGEFVRVNGISDAAVVDYVLPMGAAIWSAPSEEILSFPAESFLRFFANHGLLSLSDRPKWQTVVGGSRSYVKKFLSVFPGRVFTDSPVVEVSRLSTPSSKVLVRLKNGEGMHFDKVVFAAHADETLRLLREPTAEESRLLGAWEYQKNRTVLHRDSSVLPKNQRAWASWNYTRETNGSESLPVSVTYHMNRLQGLEGETQYFVSLNRVSSIPDEAVIAEFDYLHPKFTLRANATQKELKVLQGKHGSYFCGSYFGHGFHEDGNRSCEEASRVLLS